MLTSSSQGVRTIAGFPQVVGLGLVRNPGVRSSFEEHASVKGIYL